VGVQWDCMGEKREIQTEKDRRSRINGEEIHVYEKKKFLVKEKGRRMAWLRKGEKTLRLKKRSSNDAQGRP